MMKSRFLVMGLLICSLVSMSFGSSYFFDAPRETSSMPASLNWADTTAWFDTCGSYAPFGSVPTAGDDVFLMSDVWNDISGDPASNVAIVNSDAAGKSMQIGYWGQGASLAIENGANLNIANQSNIGVNGDAAVTQNAGTFSSTGVRIGGGNNATINLNGGQMTARSDGFVVGDAGGGTVTMNQTGGTLTTNAIAVGKSGSTGIYNMTGGTINGVQYGGNFYIGAIGSGAGSVQSEFNLGDAAGTGTIQMANTAGLAIDSRNSKLRGWGTFDLGGVQSTQSASRLWNDGQVIADGYGTDRDLDLSQFNHVETYDSINTTTNGWYAVNHGRLLLPSIAVTAGNSSYNWGDDSYFTSTNLVNSFRVTFTGVSEGKLKAALLAEDRSDVAAHDGLAFLAVWQIDQLAFANANMIFRFDDAQAAALGIDESLLNVYKLVNGAWVAQQGTVNSLANQISISTDSFGTFAVGAVVPEPVTLILLGFGAALLRKRSR
jgi:hypothetical protein